MTRIRQSQITFFLSMVFALSLRLLPQAEDIRFAHLSRDEGLSQSTVYCILQDHSGFMWFGTENGLNRFDGYDFTVFHHVPGDSSSISHSAILSLYEDRDGFIWIGTLNGGVNRYDPLKEEFQCYRHVPDRSDSLSNDIVSAILEDRDGDFWIGTDDGLNRLDRQSGRFTRYPLAVDRPGRSNHIHDLFEDREGMLWIGTFGGGLVHFNKRTGQFILYRHDANDTASLSNDFIYRVLEDREGTLWICTEGGLNRLDRKSGRFTRIPIPPASTDAPRADQVYAICEDRSGLLWIGTSLGLICLNGKTGAATAYQSNPLDTKSLSSNLVHSVYEDRSGILWVGTEDSGINTFNPNRKKFSHYRSIPGKANSLGSNLVSSFWESPDGALWIGTHMGLDRMDRKTNVFTHLGKTNIRCLQGDRTGNLWLGTDGRGLHFFDCNSGKVTVYRHDPKDPGSISSNRILALCEDMSGSLWIGTYGGGLNRMERKSGTFTRYQFAEGDQGSLSDDIVRAILVDRAGTLWIGTYGGGLNRLDRESGKFIHYRHDDSDPASLSDDYIFYLHEDKEGDIWIGTLGGGLNKLDKGRNTFSHFTETEGLASNMILGILEDRSGNLWLTTNEGLSRFSPRMKQFRNFDVRDGLQGKEFVSGSVYADQNGEMFVGGANGFNAFIPQEIFDNPYVPPVRITSFKVLNREVKLAKPIWKTAEIELSPKDSLFSFEFAALDFTASEKNQYAYKLEGLTEDWIYTDSRRRLASFSRLPPGKYIFRVKGSNSDGLWNEKDVSLVIRMRGPWWRSWWFLALLVAFMFFFLYQLKRTRIRRMTAKIKTEAALEQVYSNFNISPREKEILILLLKGKTNKEIEEQLFIELSTVKIHVHHIFRKLGINNRTQLLRLFQNLLLNRTSDA